MVIARASRPASIAGVAVSVLKVRAANIRVLILANAGKAQFVKCALNNRQIVEIKDLFLTF
jgi:hypothetical protein